MFLTLLLALNVEKAVAWYDVNSCTKLVPGWCERTMRCESRKMADGVGPVFRESFDECRKRFLKTNGGMGSMFIYYGGSRHCQATEGRNKRSDGNWQTCSPAWYNGGSFNFNFEESEKAVADPCWHTGDCETQVGSVSSSSSSDNESDESKDAESAVGETCACAGGNQEGTKNGDKVCQWKGGNCSKYREGCDAHGATICTMQKEVSMAEEVQVGALVGIKFPRELQGWCVGESHRAKIDRTVMFRETGWGARHTSHNTLNYHKCLDECGVARWNGQKPTACEWSSRYETCNVFYGSQVDASRRGPSYECFIVEDASRAECTDTASDKKDARGNGCEWYFERYWTCGRHDVEGGFQASSLCCVCGGGSMPEASVADPCYYRPEGCAETQESLTMSKSSDSVGPSQFVKAMALVGFLTTLYGAGCHFLKN